MVNYLKYIRPESGFTHFLYIAINALLPLLILVFIRLEFMPMAVLLVFLAKWRMFAVKPRYWLVNLRSNLVDIFVGLSIVSFMAYTNNIITQLVWVALYIGWLVWLKPQSKQVPVIAQSLIAQTLSLVAFYQAFPEASIAIDVVAVWLICYASARHFLGIFDEPHIKQLTHIWAWFGASLAWVLSHWVIFYINIPQIALVLTALGYGLGLIYYLSANNKLKKPARTQIIAVMGLILLIIIAFSDWQDKTI